MCTFLIHTYNEYVSLLSFLPTYNTFILIFFLHIQPISNKHFLNHSIHVDFWHSPQLLLLYNFETTRLDLLFYSLPVRLLWNARRHIWLVLIETAQHCCLKILTFQDHCLSFHLYVHLAQNQNSERMENVVVSCSREKSLKQLVILFGFVGKL